MKDTDVEILNIMIGKTEVDAGRAPSHTTPFVQGSQVNGPGTSVISPEVPGPCFSGGGWGDRDRKGRLP